MSDDPPAAPEPTTRELNQLLAAQTAILNAMTRAARGTRRNLEGRFLERYRDDGSKAFVVRVEGLGKIATATLNEPSDKPYVEDEAAFTDWVEEHRPGEVVKQVRSTYQKSLFEKGVKLTDDGVVHAKSGEVIPGLAVMKAGEPTSFTFSFEKHDGESAEQDVYELALSQPVRQLLGGREGGEDQ